MPMTAERCDITLSGRFVILTVEMPSAEAAQKWVDAAIAERAFHYVMKPDVKITDNRPKG